MVLSPNHKGTYMEGENPVFSFCSTEYIIENSKISSGARTRNPIVTLFQMNALNNKL